MLLLFDALSVLLWLACAWLLLLLLFAAWQHTDLLVCAGEVDAQTVSTAAVLEW